MTFFRTIAIAFSMYSTIPVPQFPWEKKDMRFALCAFPLVGIFIGLLMWGAAVLTVKIHIPALLRGAVYCIIPVLVTGGIHLDGYADTCDALASHAPAERKQEILQDPHVGSFAVIRLCGLFVLNFALWACLPEYRPLPILLSFVLSRILSGLSVVCFPLAKKTGLARTFADAADKTIARRVLIAADVLVSAGLCICGTDGAAMMFTAHAVFAWYSLLCRKQFGGLSGDIAGWFLVQAEKWMLIALTAVLYLEGWR